MAKNAGIPLVETGVRNLDALLGGGLPRGSVTVIGGPPGAGKTILAQQILFRNVGPKARGLYLSTLSEPTAKTLRFLREFEFFDPKLLEKSLRFVDLGSMLRTQGLEPACKLILEHVREVKPSYVVIDSFRVFDDLGRSREEVRKFGYEIAVHLMAWESTAFLLGEYGPHDFETNPLFSIVDGMIALSQRIESGEPQRFLQVVKMRGLDHSRAEHSFRISSRGIEVYTPKLSIRRQSIAEPRKGASPRMATGISKLDDLVGGGIPYGSSILVGGIAGTGKTVLLMEFIYRGALAGEKGILFSFEETEERLRSAARGLGWDFDAQVDRGNIEIVFIPQPEILVERDLLMMQERIASSGARRVALDSLSVFLHKIRDPELAREKTFQMATIVQNVGAVGFFAADIPYGATRVSRWGVEETVVDGVILLSAVEQGLERNRYIEVYKLRNTAHLSGRHPMTIREGGIAIDPRYNTDPRFQIAPPSVDPERRIPSGVPGFDALVDGGLLEASVTLLSGSAGTGKSTFGLHFLLAGLEKREPCLHVGLEEGPDQTLKGADALGLPLRKFVDRGTLEMLYLSSDRVRAAQFLSILTDRIESRGVRRIVVDSVSHLVPSDLTPEETREVLYNLVVRFKVLRATSLLTLESPSEERFSHLSDNIVQLRQREEGGRLVPTLTVVKTRGSSHDSAIHTYELGRGGLRVRK